MKSLQTAVEILQLVNTLEPAAIGLVKSLLENLQGKTTAEILAEADGIWQSVVDAAEKELG
ncbi:MAG TPA: hypothetical protein VLT85_12040 [Terriglobales bacterium]|nr:hypothetical protein [Terriglobales bacterium]